MITRHTAFVIGAGASECYRLPVAKQLADAARDLTPRSPVYQLVRTVLEPNAVHLLNATLEDLRHHPGSSIDAYLEHRQHHRPTVDCGKILIAALLGNAIAETREHPARHTREWLATIVNRMSAGAATAAEFAQSANRVTFVTFNFDSVIEDEVRLLVAATYNGHEDISTALRAVRVLHLHGHLPPVPTGAIGDGLGGVTLNWVQWLRGARGEIRVVQDDIDHGLLEQAQTLVQLSSVLCFLGFSFDRGNLAKLGLPSRLHASGVGPTGGRFVYACAYGMSDGERQRIEETFRPTTLHLGTADDKCDALLNRYYILRDS